jgi:hypothetical protein
VKRTRWLVLLFLVSLPAVTPRIYASDEIQYFAFLRSLWFDHDVSFDNEYRYFADHGIADSGFVQTNLDRVTPTGHRVTFATVGPALLWAPFYAIGDGVARVARLAGADVAVDGYSTPYVAAVCYGSACYGFAALLLAGALVRELGVRESRAALLAVWLGTPLFFYMYLAPVFAHACSAFAVALLLWVWVKVRHRWSVRDGLTLGALAALVAMVREQDALLVIGPALDFLAAWFWRRRTAGGGTPVVRARHFLACAAAGALGFAAVYWPQVLAYETLNGRLGPSQLVTRKMSWTSPHFWAVLFSPAHGLFAWTPLALVAVAGLAWLASGRAKAGCADCRWVGVLGLVMVLAQTYVSGSVESWTVAGAFGQRRFVSVTPLLVLGLAALASSARAPRPGPVGRLTRAAVLTVCVWWNVGLMVQFGAHLMDRQELRLAENARVTFGVLPVRLPSYLWQYFGHRSSFYRQPRQ